MNARLAEPIANGHPSLLGRAMDTTRPARTRTRGRIRRTAGRAWAGIRPLSGDLLGLGGFDAALWYLPIGSWTPVAGMLGLAVAGFVLQWRVKG